MELTFLGDQGSAAEEQQIDGRLSAPEMTANVVDILEKTGIIFDKMIFASRVEMFELCLDAVALAFSASEEVDARLLCLFGELFERGLADATGCTHKDCNEPSRETGGDVRVGSTHQLEGNHGGRLVISRCVSRCAVLEGLGPLVRSGEGTVELIKRRKVRKGAAVSIQSCVPGQQHHMCLPVLEHMSTSTPHAASVQHEQATNMYPSS